MAEATTEQQTQRPETEEPSFFDRTLGNLAGAWRDIAVSAARSVGMKIGDSATADPAQLREMMQECLEARGGEVSARARAAELGRTYLRLDTAGRRVFLQVLAEQFTVVESAVNEAMEAYRAAESEEDRLAAGFALRQALVPPRVKLLTQFNALPEGVKFLADLRADLLPLIEGDPYLKGLDGDLHELLSSWFDTGFLDLKRITWESSAALLEKLIAYEAVHEIRSWDDLRNRLDSDRRCYALFHPRMPKEPLAFVEVALVKGLTGNVQTLLDESAPSADPDAADTAIFYSISNTQRGLRGITFGDYLIKMVVRELNHELPQVTVFSTLSPVPGFRAWVEARDSAELDELLTADERAVIRKLGKAEDTHEALCALLARNGWHRHAPRQLEPPMLRLAAKYFTERRPDGQPIDPVARFHLRNGARLERINWLGDVSPRGLRQSAGVMVNYRYLLEDIEKNHEAYVSEGKVAVSAEVRGLMKKLDKSRLRRLGIG